ncbi:MAG: amidohydrolase family protein [Gammaproteobacteria bacterium]|nr:amidohydrolase family protein [Gammaproteobacteria bacterium]NIY31682.1 amidohydrolase family protein [Gammaproteobacteria bacterium]
MSAAEAVQRLDAQGVVLAMVSSTPPELALELHEAGGEWIVPFWRPYLDETGRHRWFYDPRVLPAARKAMASGRYQGIGEFHLIPGIGPARDNAILDGLIELAIEHDVPVSIHTEASDYRYFEPICKRYPGARFLWAHAGGLLPGSQVDSLLNACPNVWVDLSARDPWRYIKTPITDEQGRLLPEWEATIRNHPDRFMTGSDPVWPVEDIHNWAEADSGWERIGEFLDFHRRWLNGLPPELEKKIRLSNAQRFFGNAGRAPEGGTRGNP